MKAILLLLAYCLCSCAGTSQYPATPAEAAQSAYLITSKDWRKESNPGGLSALYFAHTKAKTGQASAIAQKLINTPYSGINRDVYKYVKEGKRYMGMPMCAVVMIEGLPDITSKPAGGKGFISTYTRGFRREYTMNELGRVVAYRALDSRAKSR